MKSQLGKQQSSKDGIKINSMMSLNSLKNVAYEVPGKEKKSIVKRPLISAVKMGLNSPSMKRNDMGFKFTNPDQSMTSDQKPPLWTPSQTQQRIKIHRSASPLIQNYIPEIIGQSRGVCETMGDQSRGESPMMILPQNFKPKESEGRTSQIQIDSSQVQTSVKGLIQPQVQNNQIVYNKPDISKKNTGGLPKNYSKY